MKSLYIHLYSTIVQLVGSPLCSHVGSSLHINGIDYLLEKNLMPLQFIRPPTRHERRKSLDLLPLDPTTVRVIVPLNFLEFETSFNIL